MSKTSREKQRLEAFLNRYADSTDMCREYQFHPSRRWRFDWAFPVARVAVEFEGGVFIGGGHTRGVIYSQNCEKYNTDAMMGWRVLRYTAPMVRAGEHEEQIREALDE